MKLVEVDSVYLKRIGNTSSCFGVNKDLRTGCHKTLLWYYIHQSILQETFAIEYREKGLRQDILITEKDL